MRLTLARIAVLIAATVMAGAAAAQYQPPNDRVDFATYEPQQVLAQKPLEGTHDLSLADAVALGLRFNLDVEIERYSPLIAEQESEAAWGAYDPMFDAELGYERSEFPNTFALETTETQIDRNLNGSASLQWLTPFVGATLGLVVSGAQTTTNSSIQSLSPQFNSSIAFNARIPLLRGLIWNEPWTNVKISNLGYGISRNNFTGRVMDIVQNIQNRYWDLIASKEQVRVAQQSLDTAQALLRQSQTQYEVGVVSKVDVIQAEAGVASRDFDLIVATNRYDNSQDEMISAVLGPYLTAGSTLQFVPTTNPDDFATFSKRDTESAVATAFARRPELRAAQGAIDQREIELKFAKNQWLPRFDIEGTYGYLGIDGRDNENCRFPSPGVPAGVPCNTPPVPNGNFGDTYDNYFSDSGSLNYSVRGIVSVPLGNTTARKRLTQANLQLRRSKTDERRLEQTIILDIREAVRSLDAAYRGIGAAERGSVAAAEQLRAERIRLEHGESTPFEVLLKESDLVQAESQWITAVQAYRNALTALERQQGTILESNKVNIEEASALR